MDYKKIINETNWEDAVLLVTATDKHIDIGGNKKGILYLACQLAEFALEDCLENENAEINFDAGIVSTADSCNVCVFLCEDAERLRILNKISD